MIRTILRAIGLLMSLVSFMTVMTARGPSGQPSALERIPILMDALEARLDARDARPPASRGSAAPPAVTATSAVEPSPAMEDGPAQGWPAPDLPRGSDSIRVNHGLP
ncbi:hypothetical protein [Rubellimicrobium mesophilum]|uniref:hypothetical protein n=1 Tax=Rubellimicrobium mesophilum TaxID=1123067 RepID=UPI0005619F15|nr:hypothetical protein [Rubellimicrobium mesophilum]